MFEGSSEEALQCQHNAQVATDVSASKQKSIFAEQIGHFVNKVWTNSYE